MYLVKATESKLVKPVPAVNRYFPRWLSNPIEFARTLGNRVVKIPVTGLKVKPHPV